MISLDPLGMAKTRANTLKRQLPTIVQNHSFKEYDFRSFLPSYRENTAAYQARQFP